MIVAGLDRAVAEWVQERVPLLELEERDGCPLYTALGWSDSAGRLVAGVVYDGFTRINIDTHIAAASRRALTAHFLGEAFRYPFLQLNVRRLTARVAESNTASRRFCEGVGFVREGRIRQALPGGENMIVFGMLKSECRWLEVGVYGQKQRALCA